MRRAATLGWKTKDLYKRMLFAGRDYPQGITVFRTGLKKAFLANKNEQDPAKIENALARGEYVLKEILALNSLHKYRSLRRAYSRKDLQYIPGFTNEDVFNNENTEK
eukprot:TRINITY_DN269_c0_g1_i1.p2 TRINITY_DN269_c0_g1~~TRINITY_DN269_c0_g1_i1.p2  ORF type:complete len:107 (-),score=24.09 TRINITY_DN269_c0_g1_i1:166-486(-)